MTLLEFDRVGFRYPDGATALADCSLVVEHGSRKVAESRNPER